VSTKRQLELLGFWRDFIDAREYPPSVREACDALGIARVSLNAVRDHLSALERKGLVLRNGPRRHRGHAQSRTVTLTDLGQQYAPSLRKKLPPTSTVVTERKCSCGASFFLVGHVSCGHCERAA